MRHHPSQRLGGEGLTIAVDQNGLAASVGRIQDLRQHRRDRHEKPFATRSSLVLALNDIKPVEVTLDTIDEDTASDPLIPAQARDVAAAVAEPKRQTVASACRGAELPTVFELRHRFARPGFPAGIGGPPFDRRCGIDFDPVLPQRDIDQLAYAHQQVLGLMGRGDEAAKKLFNMDTSEVLNLHVAPDERVIRYHPQF